MKIVASEVRPTATPSIGTGNASATVDATSSAKTPASVAVSGLDSMNFQNAMVATAAPPRVTGTSTGSTRNVSDANSEPNDRRGPRAIAVPAAGSLVRCWTCVWVIAFPSRCRSEFRGSALPRITS
jgi:hypothetical protein